MLIAALFTVVPNWEQLRCLSGSEWINKMWSICVMDYCSDMK